MLSTARRVSRGFRVVSDAVRSVVAPSALVRSRGEQLLADDPADVFTDEEMPAVEDIESAAAAYTTACDQARAADRGKRKAKKTLGRLPAGRYGAWIVERVPSSRTSPDLDSIRATYARLGLGPVPMKANAPSLRITEAEPAVLVGFPAVHDLVAAPLAA